MMDFWSKDTAHRGGFILPGLDAYNEALNGINACFHMRIPDADPFDFHSLANTTNKALISPYFLNVLALLREFSDKDKCLILLRGGNGAIWKDFLENEGHRVQEGDLPFWRVFKNVITDEL